MLVGYLSVMFRGPFFGFLYQLAIEVEHFALAQPLGMDFHVLLDFMDA